MEHWKNWVVLAALLMVGCSRSGIPLQEGGKAKGKLFTVDNSGDAGYYLNLDMGQQDQAHLVYYDAKSKSLKYVRQSSSGFAVDTVDDTCHRCLYATIRVTAEGDPHIAYTNDATQTLMYTYRKNNIWKREPIEWGPGTGMGARLLLDEKGMLHALYYSGDGFLKHAWRVPNDPGEAQLTPLEPRKTKRGDGGKPAAPPTEPPEGIWGNERVDKANGSEQVQISFVRKTSGGLAASYLHWSGMSSELRLAFQNEDGTWKTQVIARENNPGKSSALFFDVDGTPRVVFREALKNRLMLAREQAGAWVAEPLIHDAYNLALANDATGRVLLAYQEMHGADPRKGTLCMLIGEKGAWTRYAVDDSQGSGYFLDADFTVDSRPVIGFFEESGKKVKLFVGE
jgi:hypothetical protein